MDLIRTQIIDILHGQVPHGEVRGRGRSLQHLDIEGLVRRDSDVRKLSHSACRSVAIIVLIGNSKDFVTRKGLLEHDITQVGVQGVFSSTQQTGTLEFLVVLTTLKFICSQRRQCLRHIIYVSGVRIVILDDTIQVIGFVGGNRVCSIPEMVADVPISTLTEVHEGYQVARLVVVVALIGDPDLDARNVDS